MCRPGFVDSWEGRGRRSTNLFDLHLEPIERVEGISGDEVPDKLSGPRRPLIFSGLERHFEFLRSWGLERFSKIDDIVRAQRPQSDGVNYFTEYHRMPLSEFVARIEKGEDLYIGALQMLGRGGERSDKDGLGDLAPEVSLPPWLESSRISSGNLWLGRGGKRTLLHYDPWDGYLTVGTGQKEFLAFLNTETRNLYPYGPLDYKSLINSRVLHSKLNPRDIQERYQSRVRKVRGFRGTVAAGEMIVIPAGFWHYVESAGLNIGINFFVDFSDRNLHFSEPLRTYWIKDNITLMPVRAGRKARMLAGRVYRRFRPR